MGHDAEKAPQGATVAGGINIEDAIKAATDLLMANGRHVVPNEAFAEIKGRAAKEAEARAAALEAQLKTVEQAHGLASARLKEIDDKGKSEDQKWNERQAEWQRQQQAKDAELETMRAAHKAATSKYEQTVIDQRLGGLLTGAIDAELAILAARHRLPGELRLDEHGRLVHIDLAGVPRTGPDAESVIKAWWQTQATLRASAAPPGPPTSGGTKTGAPPEPIGPFVPPPDAPLSEQLRLAREYEARKAAAQQNR